MSRRLLLAGNAKMNLDRASARAILSVLRERVPQDRGFDVLVCPPFPYLALAVEALAGCPIRVGGQNCHHETKGAFTGEVSPAMLRDVGCTHVILGHSERRHLFGETDAMVSKKVAAALGAGLDPILCVGETLEERKAGRTQEVVRRHLVEGLSLVPAKDLGRVVVAYEPVWAIGTGVNATPEQAAEVHSHLRNLFAEAHGRAAADALRILYGGSVTPENADAIFSAPGVDGGLVGGASIDPNKAAALVECAARRASRR